MLMYQYVQYNKIVLYGPDMMKIQRQILKNATTTKKLPASLVALELLVLLVHQSCCMYAW